MSTNPNQQKKPEPNKNFLERMQQKGKQVLNRLQRVLKQATEKAKPMLVKFRDILQELLIRTKKLLSKLYVFLKELAKKTSWKLREFAHLLMKYLKKWWQVWKEKIKYAKQQRAKAKQGVAVQPDKPDTQTRKTRKKQAAAPAPIPESDETGKVQTREQFKQLKKQQKRQHKKPRRRIFPIWLRIIVVLGLSLVALMIGLMIGYGGIGDGHPLDALHKSTWQHIIDIVKQEK